MIHIQQMLLNNHNRPNKKLKELKGLVLHWTANERAGANAKANRNYFNTTSTSASAHYIVDDENIIQCIPDDEVAYHVGAKRYTEAGLKLAKSPYGPNYFLLGIEMCVNSDSVWRNTYQNTVELAAYLLKKYDLSIIDLYRHYDITGKECPKMMVNSLEWLMFKQDVKAVLELFKINNRILKVSTPYMKGEDVIHLQKLLNKHKCPCSVDGVFGPKTRDAVSYFQRVHGLLVDGIVGNKTWEALLK